jgi:hypothetical protein
LRFPNDDYGVIRLSTYKIDNLRYVSYDSKEYLAENFLKIDQKNLELRIIELDHLPEEDQRARGLLLPHEPYIPKVRNVSKMSSESAVKLESLKCQHLCMKCHLQETIDREIGTPYNSKSYAEREKLEYVNKIKEENLGCSICGYWNPNLIRFFDLDHIVPENKIKEVARIVKDNSYSMQDLIDECKKCRVLCRDCHRIHTIKQRRGDF